MIDWYLLAKKLGTIKELDGGRFEESGGGGIPKRALAEILGDKEIEAAVEFILKRKRGSELALSVLLSIDREKASKHLIKKYQNSKEGDEERKEIVYMLAKLAHPVSIKWAKVFLKAEDVIYGAIELVNQLLYQGQIEEKEAIEMIDSVKNHPDTAVKNRIKIILEEIKEHHQYSNQNVDETFKLRN